MLSIITWNIQGSSHSFENKWNEGVRNLMTKFEADVACLQECGAVPASAQLLNNAFSGIAGLELYRWGTDRAHLFILFMQTDIRGNRCNLAIVSRTQPAAGLVLYPANQPTWRPAVGAAIGGDALFTLHAISPRGPDVGGLLTSIQAAIGNAHQWVAAGDYNRDPATLPVGYWNVCPPNGPTYSTLNRVSTLDYLSVRGDIAAVQGTVLDLVMSDHFPVLFRLP